MFLRIVSFCLFVSVALSQEPDECNRACTFDYRPVCGTFKKTFGNRCSMNAEACRQAARGYTLVQDEEEECSCPKICPAIYSPVCGSDGSTYDNECVMRNQACEAGKWVEVATEEECDRPVLS